MVVDGFGRAVALYRRILELQGRPRITAEDKRAISILKLRWFHLEQTLKSKVVEHVSRRPDNTS